jgi:hypothetical protein
MLCRRLHSSAILQDRFSCGISQDLGGGAYIIEIGREFYIYLTPLEDGNVNPSAQKIDAAFPGDFTDVCPSVHNAEAIIAILATSPP